MQDDKQAPFDIVIFGASGFTGNLATQYLSRHNGKGLRLAIAGRNQDKLNTIAAACEIPPAVIVADSSDPTSIQKMVAQTHVVANFAGPFSLYAEPVIAACVEQGKSYCDITGETPFIRRMILKYQGTALKNGACLIPFSGFDSVPADVCTFLAMQQAAANSWHLDRLTHYYQLRAGLNGGTLASALALAEQGMSKELVNPNVLIPEANWSRGPRPSLGPSYEPLLKKWSAPFIMGPVNTAVVRRSAFLKQPHPDRTPPFSYEERMLLGGELKGRMAAYLATGALAGFGLLTATDRGRTLLRKIGPKPGEGPAKRDANFYRGQLIARSKGEAKLKVTITCSGDPGNEITVLFASEIAKLLAERKQAAHAQGFTTPSVAFEQLLHERLEKAGVNFSVEKL